MTPAPAAQVPEFSLRQLCKKTVEDMFDKAVSKAQGNYFCMVVDKTTVRILSSVVLLTDLVHLGATVVEIIGKVRQPLPLDVLYFLMPTAENVERLLEDFPEGRPGLYAGIHIFFAYELPKQLFEKICRQKHVAKRVRNFVDLHMEFLSKNHRCFHFDHPSLLDPDEEELHQVVRGLVSVALTLGQWPTVRYQSDCAFAENIAKALEDSLTEYWQKKDDAPKTECVFLVLDRSVDLAAPLLHEFTYEALAYDVLDGTSIDPREDSFEYVKVNAVGTQTKKKVQLSDDDDLWVQYRHQHIATARDKLNDEFNSFTRNNDTAQLQKQNNSMRDPNATARMIRGIPEYQEQVSKLNYHMDMIIECFQVFEQKIKVLAAVEQDLATGVDCHGKETNCMKVMCQLVTIFPDCNLSSEIKIRLLLLYLATMNDIESRHVDTMIEAAQLLEEEKQEWIDPFLKRYFKPVLKGEKKSPFHASKIPKRRRDFFREKAKRLHADFELSRFDPMLKTILEELIEGKLDAEQFPAVGNRSTKWTPRSKGTAAGSRRRGPVPNVLCYIHGGVTYSESRVAFEVSEVFPVDIVVGGNRMLTPKIFLESLRGG